VAPARRVRAGLSAFVGASAALAAAGAAATIAWSRSMAAPCGGPAMAWLPVPGRTQAGAAAAFAGMWIVMMVPMMMPSLAPALWRYRQALGALGPARWGALTAMAGAGYFFVWGLLGVAVYPLGLLYAQTGTRVAVGAVFLAAGLVQASAWKQRQLACCRAAADCAADLPARASAAWLHGMHLGVRCVLACANLMAVLLAAGLMDLATMAALTVAITLERLAPAGLGLERAMGAVLAGAGIFLLAQ